MDLAENLTSFRTLCSLSRADEGRQIAANMRGIGAMPIDLPAWKRYAFGGNQVSYGKKTELSILQQRESLPIFKLKDELVQVSDKPAFERRLERYKATLQHVQIPPSLLRHFNTRSFFPSAGRPRQSDLDCSRRNGFW